MALGFGLECGDSSPLWVFLWGFPSASRRARLSGRKENPKEKPKAAKNRRTPNQIPNRQLRPARNHRPRRRLGAPGALPAREDTRLIAVLLAASQREARLVHAHPVRIVLQTSRRRVAFRAFLPVEAQEPDLPAI